MKIVYINGYKGETSSKVNTLEKMLGETITRGIYIYSNNEEDTDANIKHIKEVCADADLIIGSSTGAYIARHIAHYYNLPLISLNPVIDLEETFNKIGVKAPSLLKYRLDDNYLLEELVLLNKDDELIDYKPTVELRHNCRVYEKGGHRFENLTETKEEMLDFIRRIF